MYENSLPYYTELHYVVIYFTKLFLFEKNTNDDLKNIFTIICLIFLLKTYCLRKILKLIKNK